MTEAIHFREFVCTCSDEGKAEAAALMTEVYERLSGGSEGLKPCDVTPGNFLTMVVVSLEWDFGAYITGILNDQWSGVYAENYDKTFKTSVECDEVEHGLAMTWKAFADRASVVQRENADL